MTNRFGRLAATLTLILGLYLASAVPAAAQTVYGIKFTVSSQPGTTTVRNIDVAGGLPITKIKRYTVSIGPMKIVPKGVVQVLIRGGVVTDNGSQATVVWKEDASNLSDGAAVAPFAGTNSSVQVQRGNDNLGTISFVLNAYVEVAP